VTEQGLTMHSPHNRSFLRRVFQATDCTDTDNQKQGNKPLHAP